MYRSVLLAACAALVSAATAGAVTFDVVEADSRSDADLPPGVTAAGADFTASPFVTGTTYILNDPLLGGADFGASDTIRIFGRMGRGEDRFQVTFDAPFRVFVDFLTDDSATNDPVFRLEETAGGTAFAEYPGAVARGAPVALGGGAAFGPGTFVFEVDGDDQGGLNSREFYDVAIVGGTAAIPLPGSVVLLIGGLGGLAALRRRG